MISLSLSPYHVVFPGPARDADEERLDRHGALLVLRAGELCGTGELAPLPRRSRETLDDCWAALESLDRQALPSLAELGGPDWFAAVGRASAFLPAGLAAARHALETALLDLCGALSGVPAPKLLAQALGRSEPAARLPVAGLIDAFELSEARRQAERFAAQGIGTVKLKIAGSEPSEAICERVRELALLLRVRVDANRSLSLEQFSELARGLAAQRIEFLEEPLPLAALPPAPHALPLAVDESLLEPDFSLARARDRGASVLVLKPMLLGFLRAVELALGAGAAGFDVVLSHSFDGPHAMAAARCLALALGPRRYADGLAAHAALAAWTAPLPPHVNAPALSLWTRAGLGNP